MCTGPSAFLLISSILYETDFSVSGLTQFRLIDPQNSFNLRHFTEHIKISLNTFFPSNFFHRTNVKQVTLCSFYDMFVISFPQPLVVEPKPYFGEFGEPLLIQRTENEIHYITSQTRPTVSRQKLRFLGMLLMANFFIDF